MAGKYFSLEEAATMLGVTPTALNEMRQRGDINAMRDGGGWKFKQEELDRVRSDRSGIPDNSAFDLPLDLDSKQDIVLSDLDLAESGEGGSTMSGGKSPEGAAGSDIELRMGSDSGLDLLSSSGIDPGLGPDSPATPPSGISFTSGGSGIDFIGSDVKLAPQSGEGKDPSLSGMGSNVLTGGSSKGGPESGKTMLTAELADRVGPESSVKMSMRDSESVFGEPDSDVSRNIEGSGINLLDARDSGLNLDDLQLASSISGIAQKKKQGSDLGMQGEEDFLLTPLEEQTDDSTDSGSQVIALEGEFGDDATATLMAGDVPGLGAMLEAADGGGLSPMGGGPMGAPGQVVYAAPPEASYGIGTVLALALSTVVMGMVGVMMYDIVRNMWSWDTPYTFNSTLMDMILGMFG